MKQLLIILSFLLLSSSLFGQSEETCYVAAHSKDSKEFDPTLLSNISISLISEFLKEVEPLPPAGISMDTCIYHIDAVKVKETTFVTFKGKNLNSFGDSKLSGPDGFQESILKALYRALEDKRKLICDTNGEFIEKCGGVVKKISAEKIETIREMKNKYDQLEKRIAVLDTRIEILNIGEVKVATNPHSFGNLKPELKSEPIPKPKPEPKPEPKLEVEPFNFIGKWQTVGDYEKTKVGKEGKVYEISKTSNGFKIKITDDSGSGGPFWTMEDLYNITDIQTKNSFTLLGWKEGTLAAEKCNAKCPKGYIGRKFFSKGAAKIYKNCVTKYGYVDGYNEGNLQGKVKEGHYFYCEIEKGEYIPMEGVSKSQNKQMKKMHEARYWHAFVRLSEIENID